MSHSGKLGKVISGESVIDTAEWQIFLKKTEEKIDKLLKSEE